MRRGGGQDHLQPAVWDGTVSHEWTQLPMKYSPASPMEFCRFREFFRDVRPKFSRLSLFYFLFGKLVRPSPANFFSI